MVHLRYVDPELGAREALRMTPVCDSVKVWSFSSGDV
jgi:hypothetical protein